MTLLALLLAAARAEDVLTFGWAPGWRGTRPPRPASVEVVRDGTTKDGGIVGHGTVRVRVEPGPLRPWALVRPSERPPLTGPDVAPRDVRWVDTKTRVWRWTR